MRKFLPFLLSLLSLLSSLPSPAADLAGVLAWEIPEGPVARVEVEGETVWPSIPYATNGLVAYWDGIWNAGLGVHDSTTTTWVDLSTNHFDATQRVATGWAWGSDAYIGTMSNGHGFAVNTNFTAMFAKALTNHTVEIVALARVNNRMVFFGGYTSPPINFESWWPGQASSPWGFRIYYNGTPSGYSSNAPTMERRATFASVATSTNTSIMKDGSFLVAYGAVSSFYVAPNKPFVLGGENQRSNMSLRGELYAVRIYDRPLTVAEIARHATIDAVRFGIVSEAPSAAMLSASSPRTLSSSAPLALDAAPATLEDLAPDDFTDDDSTDPYALPDNIDHQEESSNLEFEDFAAFDDPADESEAAPEPEESR